MLLGIVGVRGQRRRQAAIEAAEKLYHAETSARLATQFAVRVAS
jgi:hypothetical protein